jgi:hypothetical protein
MSCTIRLQPSGASDHVSAYALRLLIALRLSLSDAILIDRFTDTVGHDPTADLLTGDTAPVRVDQCRLLHRDRCATGNLSADRQCGHATT